MHSDWRIGVYFLPQVNGLCFRTHKVLASIIHLMYDYRIDADRNQSQSLQLLLVFHESAVLYFMYVLHSVHSIDLISLFKFKNIKPDIKFGGHLCFCNAPISIFVCYRTTLKLDCFNSLTILVILPFLNNTLVEELLAILTHHYIHVCRIVFLCCRYLCKLSFHDVVTHLVKYYTVCV